MAGNAVRLHQMAQEAVSMLDLYPDMGRERSGFVRASQTIEKLR